MYRFTDIYFINSANLIDANQLLGLDNNNNSSNNINNFSYEFGSNATNLEYSILSNMLGSPQFIDNSQNKNWNSNNNNTNDTQNTATSTPSNASTPAYTPNLVGDPILYSPQQHSDPATFAIAKIDQSPKSNLIITPPPSFKKNHFRAAWYSNTILYHNSTTAQQHITIK